MNPQSLQHLGTVIAHIIIAAGIGILWHFGFQATALGVAVYYLMPIE